MKLRYPSLGLLFAAEAALGVAIAIAAIAIPDTVARASQFSNPAAVSSQVNNYVSQQVQTYIRFVPAIPLPTLRGPAYQFIDVRTGQVLRVAVGDTVPVRFADGSTMQMAFTGIPSSGGFHFHAIYNTLRAPGVPLYPPTPQAPVGGSPIGRDGLHHGRGREDHYVYRGGDFGWPSIGGQESDVDACSRGVVSRCAFTGAN